MTEDELEELIGDCPTLYHMAERGAWGAIKERGLLSTTALLNLYETPQPRRREIEEEHRPSNTPIERNGLPRAVIRDQIPMSDKGLERCLPDDMTPADWYRLLNSKVFFWLTEDRLHKLTGARAYRDREHDVLEVDTRSLIEAHRGCIWLCPMNSGCTKPYPHPRGRDTFARIAKYPYSHWQAKRRRGEWVVELAVDYSVPDIRHHVKRVIVKKGTTTLGVIEHAVGVPDHKSMLGPFRVWCSRLNCLWRRFQACWSRWSRGLPLTLTKGAQ